MCIKSCLQLVKLCVHVVYPTSVPSSMCESKKLSMLLKPALLRAAFSCFVSALGCV